MKLVLAIALVVIGISTIILNLPFEYQVIVFPISILIATIGILNL